MALKRCRECGKPVSTEANVCPHCGVPNPTLPGIRKASSARTRIGASLIAILGVLGLISYFDSGSSSEPPAPDPVAVNAESDASSQHDNDVAAMQRQAAQETQSAREAQAQKEASVEVALQTARRTQEAFERARVGLYGAYKSAPNEIRASAIFNRANAETAALIARNGPRIVNWAGTISELTTSHGGVDVHVEIKTSNNVVYEADNDAPAGSKIYRQLSTLRQGQQVFFSGTLVPADSGGWERSLTEEGSLREPEFGVAFSSIGASPVGR